MKIIFDLDYTLLDTLKFAKDLAEIFYGLDFYADYKKYFKDKGVSFAIDKYLAVLKDKAIIDRAREEEIKLKLDELMKNMDNYLFPGAENVLKRFKDSGAELILMTFGNKMWQEEKVKNLSLKQYFAKIIFAEKDKSQSAYLKSLGETDDEILIINDNISEAEEMLKILKKGELRLVKGPYNKESKPQIYELKDLIEEKTESKELNLR